MFEAKEKMKNAAGAGFVVMEVYPRILILAVGHCGCCSCCCYSFLMVEVEYLVEAVGFYKCPCVLPSVYFPLSIQTLLFLFLAFFFFLFSY